MKCPNCNSNDLSWEMGGGHFCNHCRKRIKLSELKHTKPNKGTCHIMLKGAQEND